MEQKLKQRICIEFCVKLQISATETFEMLDKAFPNDAPKRTTVFEWHSRFKAGRISIEDDPRQGHPKFQRTDENVQKITDLIKENPRTTLLELEQDTGISKTTIGRIVTEDLKLKKTPAKFIPRFLTNEQNLCRLATCEDMMEMTRTDPEWKDKIITGDETWVYGYDPETKPQSAEWRGQTVSKEMYLGILRRLREAIRKKKRPEKWTNGGWILHHDNARPHTAHLMTSFLAKNGTQILLQPPYFPDIAPNDFFLFPKLKAVLKGRHFDTRDDIIEKSPLALKSIPKEAYKNCFDNWEKRWRWSVEIERAAILRDIKLSAHGGLARVQEGMEGQDTMTWSTMAIRYVDLLKALCHLPGNIDTESRNHHMNGLEKNATETFQMLQKAFKDDCISRSQSWKWHKAFKEGQEEVADEPLSGRPTTARTDENVDRVLEVLRTDRRLSIQQIADTLHMSTFVLHGIVTEDFQMRKVCAKLVPKMLTQDQKELRGLRCQELLDLIQNEPDFLNSVVTGDESWMFEYDPESKRQSCAWHTKSSPRPKKARMSKSRIKTMIIVFFDIRGIVHCEFVPQGQTVNSAFYLEVLRRMKRRIARVRTDIKDTVKLHHDNATSHTAFIITNFLARSNTPVIPHPPYSLDLAPSDYFLFP
ncbi:hypothetical protein LAZ67_X004851 [Cordylochernes scorpioides]|uniref:Mos1 transposase HTH domain-containing protein n=1 Tax=Cordylochernes scorpioides TaxID=51811 RepID=A0ABY6LV83_9ARAC|nr:hypothetical protein LAZ67_X004851 [Cordylochernes scorpioides]